MMKKNDSEWSCSVVCGSGPSSAFHSRFVNQYTFFQKFEISIVGQENFNIMDVLSQISPYSETRVAVQMRHCVREIVADMLISGSCIYRFDKKKRDWKFAIPEELGGEKFFAKKVLLLNDFLQEKAKLYMQNSSILKRIYKEHLIAASKAFRCWGFYLTDASDVSGFYLAYAHLKVERTKAILRDYVLSTIEKNLNSMGYGIKFKVSKIRSMNELDKEIEKLNKGLLSPTDAFEIKEAFA